MTITQVRPAPTALETLRYDMQLTVTAYEDAAAEQARREAAIRAALSEANRHGAGRNARRGRRGAAPRSTLPVIRDRGLYDDGGEEVATLKRFVLRQNEGQPRMWIPVREAMRQWEIPDLPKALYLTEQYTLARQTPSVVMRKDMREIIPLHHPYVTANTGAIRDGLSAMRFALLNT